jgi:hypothetical protein
MSLRAPRITALVLGLALAGSFAAAPLSQAAAAGDGQGSAQTAQKSGQSAPDFSDEKLRNFAAAAVKVVELRQTWVPKIRKAQQAGNREKAQNLSKQARQEMQAEIKSAEGISFQEYRQIANAARNDRDLQKKLSGMIKDMQSGQGGGN